MKVATGKVQAAGKPAWVLLEVLLAMAVFAIAISQFVVVLNKSAELNMKARQKVYLERTLASALNEVCMQSSLEQGEFQLGEFLIPEVSPGKIYITVVVEPLELVNKDDVQLPDMYNIVAIASWNDAERTPRRQSLSTWRYAKLYSR